MRTILFIILLTAAAIAGTRADYILLIKPQQSLILNIYEQTLSRPLPVGTPLRIVQPHMVLSDSLTKADKVEFDGRIYYLLSGQDVQKKIRRALVLNDTVTIQAKPVRWEPVLAFSKHPLLSRGSRVKRYFKTRHRTYLFNNGFGWARLSEKDVKRLIKPAEPLRTLPPALKARIRARVESANQSLRALTRYFNTKFSRNREAPQWQIHNNTNTLRIAFLKPDTARFFIRSVTVLQDEINQILLGTVFGCTLTNGTLIVKRKRS